MTSLVTAIQNSVILMDGAMGSELIRSGSSPSECLDLLNLTHPNSVLSVHRTYVAAGAKVLLTNTFQTNSDTFMRHGRVSEIKPAFEAGISLARQAVGDNGWVLADIGPWEAEHAGDLACLVRAADSADGIMVETQSDDRVARFLAGANRPLFLSFAFRHAESDHDLMTFADLTPEQCAAIAVQVGAVALGVNCGQEISMADVAKVLRRYRKSTDLPLFARPNAGTPVKDQGTWTYPRSPPYMADEVASLLAAGATMVGGCCGTTPEHIAAITAKLASIRPMCLGKLKG